MIFNLHPTNPEYVLARVRAAECNVPGLQKQCSVDLYVSTVSVAPEFRCEPAPA